MKFVGWQEAKNYAALESKKSTTTFYLIISRVGGIHYLVKTNIDNLNADESVLSKFEKGEIVK